MKLLCCFGCNQSSCEVQRRGCLGGTRAVMKQSTQYLPIIGWSMWFSEYVFLARNWAKDERTLKVFTILSNSCNALHFRTALETCLHVVFSDDTLTDATK